MPPTQLMRQITGDSFFYMLYFQQPGVADADLGRDPATTMRRMLAGLTLVDGGAAQPSAALADDGRGFADRLPEPGGLPAWLRQDELDHHIAEFTRTGFTGGINWYRNLDRNWHLSEHLAGAKVEVPALFIGGSNDPVLLMGHDWAGPAATLDSYRLFAREVIPPFQGQLAAPRASHEWATAKRGELFGAAGHAILDAITSHAEEKAADAAAANGDDAAGGATGAAAVTEGS